MKWLNRLGSIALAMFALNAIKNFLSKNTIVVFEKIDEEDEDYEDDGPTNIVNLKPENYDHSMDLRGTPTHICPCGCEIFNVKVIFDNFEIATYFLDMECSNCGSLATAPTPIDTKGEF